MGMPHDNVTRCDTRGVIYQGRLDGMNQWKSAHAVATDRRTLTEALEGADAFFGLSAKGAVTRDMVRGVGPQPTIFALHNTDSEIHPEHVQAVRDRKCGGEGKGGSGQPK